MFYTHIYYYLTISTVSIILFLISMQHKEITFINTIPINIHFCFIGNISELYITTLL